MRTFSSLCCLSFLLILLPSAFSSAQTPDIMGYESSGIMTFSSPQTDAFTLEFTTSLDEPWTNWGSVVGQPITGEVMSTVTPIFYRIKAVDTGVVSNRSFRNYLVSNGFDHNDDGVIDKDEADAITQLGERSSVGFQSLDFTPFTNLEYVLFFYGLPHLTNLIVIANTHLQTLSVGGGKLTQLDLPESISLESITCGGNLLTNLDLAHVPALKWLSCENNNIERLDISGNTNLIGVTANGNPLSEIVVWWDPTNSSPINLQYDGSPILTNP